MWYMGVTCMRLWCADVCYVMRAYLRLWCVLIYVTYMYALAWVYIRHVCLRTRGACVVYIKTNKPVIHWLVYLHPNLWRRGLSNHFSNCYILNTNVAITVPYRIARVTAGQSVCNVCNVSYVSITSILADVSQVAREKCHHRAEFQLYQSQP